MIPDRTKERLLGGEFDLSANTIRVALLKETTEYTPDSAAHEFVGDVITSGVGDEMDDTGYSRLTLSGLSLIEDNTDSEGVWDASDLTFPSLGGSQTVEAVVIYRQVGGDDTTPADDDIIRIIDDSEAADLPKATNGDDFQITWDAEGIVNLT